MAERLLNTPGANYGESWKQIIRALFQQFIRFYAPKAARYIDWNMMPEFLDTEQRRIAREIHTTRRPADVTATVEAANSNNRM